MKQRTKKFGVPDPVVKLSELTKFSCIKCRVVVGIVEGKRITGCSCGLFLSEVSPYLRPTKDIKVERVGKIRIN